VIKGQESNERMIGREWKKGVWRRDGEGREGIGQLDNV